MDKVEKGRTGEEAAAEFLRQKGWTILARNVTYRGGELDIVAQDGDVIVFVEVKTRYSLRYGTPLEAVTPAKQRFLVRAAGRYLYDNHITDRLARFDVIGIRGSSIEQIENAFDATGWWN